MLKKLTPWQQLARIAYKYKMPTRGYDVTEIGAALLRNPHVSEEDKKRVDDILKEWLRNGNRN